MPLPSANPVRPDISGLLRRQRLVCLAFSLCLLAQARPASVPTEPAAPDTVLAALVFNFCLFTNWPDLGLDSPPERPLVIVNQGKAFPALAPLSGRTVRKHSVRVVSLAVGDKLPADCHVLILSGLTASQRDTALALAAGRPILTISQQPGFCEAGGILEFFVADERMRFRIDQQRMKQAGIRIHSRLLNLAEPVPPPKGRD